ncbi:MAG: outer membrane beta-barrel domain-containing protein, partial [Myxococcales bacterium]|nr:outer membrane beta-barrel domain-containing protein [Myxococcales bacterium]
MKSFLRGVLAIGLSLSAIVALPTFASAQDDEAQVTGPLADELQDFWGEQRGTIVLQRRLYEKDGRHQITIWGGVIPNNPFLDYYPIGLRYGFYLLESLAIEVDGSYIGETFRSESDLSVFLEERGVNVDLLDLTQWRAHFGLNWSPFYGKLAFLGLKLVHFDLNLFAGFGVVQIENITVDRLGTETEIRPEGSLGAGFNFYINDTFSIRFDYRQYLSEKTGGGVSNPSEIS